MVTASRIPVPLPMAPETIDLMLVGEMTETPGKQAERSDSPRKSAKTERAPIHRPPKAAAVGMYRFNSWIIDFSRCPLITICWSLSCLATCRSKISKTISSSHRYRDNPVCSTHVLGTGARHIDPCLGEEGAGAEHEHDVDNGVYGVHIDMRKCLWR